MRVLPFLPVFWLGLSSAWAQAPAAPLDQRIQRIEVQDSGARISEVRMGGETQRIHVQPANGLPGYEIVPAHGARNRPLGERDSASGHSGQRVWKLLSF